jgi:hypothetical protein
MGTRPMRGESKLMFQSRCVCEEMQANPPPRADL